MPALLGWVGAIIVTVHSNERLRSALVSKDTALSWDQAIRVVAETVVAMVPFGDPARMVSDVNGLRTCFGSSMGDPYLRDDLYLGLATDAAIASDDPDPVEMIRHVAAMGIRKQHDYGQEGILAFGHDGIIVRIADKMARITNLEGRGVCPSNEALADSYYDIIGYCLIGLMVSAGTFTLALESEGL